MYASTSRPGVPLAPLEFGVLRDVVAGVAARVDGRAVVDVPFADRPVVPAVAPDVGGGGLVAAGFAAVEPAVDEPDVPLPVAAFVDAPVAGEVDVAALVVAGADFVAAAVLAPPVAAAVFADEVVAFVVLDVVVAAFALAVDDLLAVPLFAASFALAVLMLSARMLSARTLSACVLGAGRFVVPCARATCGAAARASSVAAAISMRVPGFAAARGDSGHRVTESDMAIGAS